MARKARKKSAAKAKKKRAAVTKTKRKSAATKQSKPARRKTAPKAKTKPTPKPKGVLAEIAGGFAAVMDTLSEAERLRHKLEPRMAADPE